MGNYLDEMNALIQKADYYQHDLKDDVEAEKLYREALRFPDCAPRYILGKFLFFDGRTDEGELFVTAAADEGYPPAAVFKAMQYLNANGLPIKDDSLVSILSVAAEKGHLMAKQILVENELKQTSSFRKMFRLAVQLRKLIKQIKKIQNNPDVPQDHVWF